MSPKKPKISRRSCMQLSVLKISDMTDAQSKKYSKDAQNQEISHPKFSLSANFDASQSFHNKFTVKFTDYTHGPYKPQPQPQPDSDLVKESYGAEKAEEKDAQESEKNLNSKEKEKSAEILKPIKWRRYGEQILDIRTQKFPPFHNSCEDEQIVDFSSAPNSSQFFPVNLNESSFNILAGNQANLSDQTSYFSMYSTPFFPTPICEIEETRAENVAQSDESEKNLSPPQEFQTFGKKFDFGSDETFPAHLNSNLKRKQRKSFSLEEENLAEKSAEQTFSKPENSLENQQIKTLSNKEEISSFDKKKKISFDKKSSCKKKFFHDNHKRTTRSGKLRVGQKLDITFGENISPPQISTLSNSSYFYPCRPQNYSSVNSNFYSLETFHPCFNLLNSTT
eukprot:Sdes_comp18397_c0_seq1m8230